MVIIDEYRILYKFIIGLSRTCTVIMKSGIPLGSHAAMNGCQAIRLNSGRRFETGNRLPVLIWLTLVIDWMKLNSGSFEIN